MEDQSTEAEILQPTNRSRITEVFLPPWNPKLPRVFFYALVEFQTYFCDRLSLAEGDSLTRLRVVLVLDLEQLRF